MTQLTSKKTCAQKTTYRTNEAAGRAVRRRNKAAGYKYLRRYQCNVCLRWHVTTQAQDADPTEYNQVKEK